jgi:hypothetical protein
MRNVEFSHMQESGISYAVAVSDGIAYLSSTFLNREDKDVFVKKEARVYLACRLGLAMFFGPTHCTTSRPVKIGTRALDIIRDMRKTFKPDGIEEPTHFMLDTPAGPVRMPRTKLSHLPNVPSAWDVLVTAFEQATKAVS